VFLAGMSPYDRDKNLIGDDLGTQTKQAFLNMQEALHASGPR
jgi:enamine deaminase RidA (YjgF/YER057c/UK114 family)